MMNSALPSGLRVLALDLDDTLLHSDLSISSRTRNAIKRIEAAGVTVVLASGRIPAAMEQFSRLLGLNKRPGYLVSNNGALIQESHTGKIIHEARMEAGTILTLCDLADAEGFPLQMYENDIIYVSRHNEYSSLDQKATGFRQVLVENFRAMAGAVCHKLIIPGDPAHLVFLQEFISNFLGENITLSTSRPYLLDIMPKDTDKGSALAKIAKILKVSAAEVLAIGDSMNDEAMIRWAGIGVALANADERIKSIANYIAEHTNDDDGVADVIEKYFLNNG